MIRRRAAAPGSTITENRKARHAYIIEETLEAGLVLLGAEVKSLRAGRASLDQAYALSRADGLYLVNSFIGPYAPAGHLSHAPRRARKLLLHKKQVNRFAGAANRAGMTLAPLRLYFDDKGRAKVELAIVRGRKVADKRAREKERDWERRKGALLRRKM